MRIPGVLWYVSAKFEQFMNICNFLLLFCLPVFTRRAKFFIIATRKWRRPYTKAAFAGGTTRQVPPLHILEVLMKNLKKRLALMLAALCLFLLSGCAGAEEGLSLSVSVGDTPSSLDPIYAEEAGDQTILTHLYENLMRVTVDASGQTSVVNGMAKSVVQEEETVEGGIEVTYTFRLRSARWSDGQAVKAGDFVYAWQRLADPDSNSPYAGLLSVVKGYQEARAAKDMSLLQVSAKNDTTLVVVLDGRHDWFLNEVCTAPAAMPLRQDIVQKLKLATGNWWSAPTLLVTNGPYCAAEYEDGEYIRLEKNERYYSSQSGPYDITFHFADPEEAESLYASRTIDAAGPLPESRLEELTTEENWTALPELKTYTVVFNCMEEPFANASLREAMSLAIDRNALAQAAGVSSRAAEGVVPPGVPENEEGDFRTVGGPLLDNDPALYAENCRQAREILIEGGYDSGADVGELEFLYLEEGNGGEAAKLLCRQWQEVLQIQVTPRGVTERELMGELRSGNYTVAGMRLASAVNDAECFLADWTSKSYNNVAGYESIAYDTLMSIIASAADGTARMGCLHDAEELLLMEHVLAPMYTKGVVWEMRETLAGAFRDPRGWFSFSGVYTRTA